MTKQQFTVHGTSCKSCEVLIERELKKQDGIVSVCVSHKKQSLEIETENNRIYTSEEVDHVLRPHGYSTKQAISSQKVSPQNWQYIGAMILFVISLYIIFDRIGLLSFSPSSAEPASFIGIFIIGLIASVSSCTAIVGGLVASMSGALAKESAHLTMRERFMPHVYFNLGRIGGFFILGALIGYLGTVMQLSPALNGIFVLIIALFMIMIGLNLLELHLFPSIGMPKWIAHRIHDMAESKQASTPMLLGALTFFLPCGFTQSMQLFALTLQDPLKSGLVMAVFALGTTPVLLGIGKITSIISGKTLAYAMRIIGILILVLGISNIMNGLTLLGINPTFTRERTETGNAGISEMINGRQRINMNILARGAYEPSVLTVTKDIPVDWHIWGANFLGCADTLILPAFNVNKALIPGNNLIQFTPTKTGTFTFSCSMGMIRGTMIVK